MTRSPVILLLAASALGLIALAASPLAAVVLAGALVVAGAVVRGRGDKATGFGLVATGGALFLAAVLVLVVVEAKQDEPIILGPDTGLTPAPSIPRSEGPLGPSIPRSEGPLGP